MLEQYHRAARLPYGTSVQRGNAGEDLPVPAGARRANVHPQGAPPGGIALDLLLDQVEKYLDRRPDSQRSEVGAGAAPVWGRARAASALPGVESSANAVRGGWPGVRLSAGETERLSRQAQAVFDTRRGDQRQVIEVVGRPAGCWKCCHGTHPQPLCFQAR